MTDVRHGSKQASQETADLVEARVIAPLRKARLEPDDLQLARLGAALDTALQSAALRRARAPEPAAPRAARRGAIGVALAAAAIAALLAGPWRHRAPPVDAARIGATPLPIAYENDGRAPAGPVPRALVVPAGVRQRGRIGERVRFTLVGPAEISAFAVGGSTEIDLASGRLLVDYDGHGGETLRVRSPGAVTTVIGTLFAVEASGRASRVAVARGSVSVEGAGARVRQIGAGRSWLTEAPDSEPIASDLAADLAAHDGAIAPAGVTGELAHDARLPPSAATAAAHPDLPRRPPRPLAAREAETAYAAAEELMRTGSTTAARRALLDFVTAHPRDPRAELALLDLARLDLAAGHPIAARAHVAKLLATTKDVALIDLAHQVERRIEAATATDGE
jgi:hypothetical protein